MSSLPYVALASGETATKAQIMTARPITARVARIISGDPWEYVDSVLYSQNPRGRPIQLMATAIHSRSSETLIRSVIRELWFPGDVTMLVPWISDTVFNPPLDHFSVYIEHIWAGLRFTLLLLIVELLGFYGIALTQLVPNAIRVITGFEKLCRSRG